MTLDESAIVAEFERLNSIRTRGPITPENDTIQLQAMCPDGYAVVEGLGRPGAEYIIRNAEAENNLHFYAYCGTHIDTLLSLAARVAELEAELAAVAATKGEP